MRIWVSAVCILLSSCTAAPRANVINETGEGLGVHVENRRALNLPDKVVALRAGERRLFWIDQAFNWERMTFRVGECDYSYVRPEGNLRLHIPDVERVYGSGVAVRLADDATPYLVIVVGGLDSTGRFRSERLDASPIRPIEKTCPPATSPS